MVLRPPLVVGVRDLASLETVAWTADVADATGVSVIVVHATPPPASTDPIDGWAVPDDGADLRPWVDARFAEPLRLRGVRYGVRVVSGSVAPVLVAVGHVEQAAAIVVGVRPRPWWRRRPAVATALQRTAGRPVCAVPHAGERLSGWLATVERVTAAIDER